MSQTNDDPRVTAYVFGELTPQQTEAFERELKQSPELSREVAAVRDAVAALRSEFELHSRDVSPKQRQAVESAIEESTRSAASDVRPATLSPGSSSTNHAKILAALAASFLMVAALSYPYWSSRSVTEVSMNQTESNAPALAEEWEGPMVEDGTVANETARAKQEVEILQREMAGGKGLPAPTTRPSPADVGAIAAPSSEEEAGLYDSLRASKDSSNALDIDAEEFEMQMNDDLYGAMPAEPSGGQPTGVGGRSGRSRMRMDDMMKGGMMLEGEEPAQVMMDKDDDGRMMGMGMGIAGGSRGASQSTSRPAPSASSLGISLGEEGEVDRLSMEVTGAGIVEPPVQEGRRNVVAGGRYAPVQDNPFLQVNQRPLSTFSIDVDTASYGKIRGLLRNNILPRPEMVRIEELLNYFDYDYPGPGDDEHPFAASMEIAECPWNTDHKIARVGIQAREIETQRPASNLVFLLDVSGSMDEPAKLPLVIEGMKLLTDQLNENDKVAIVVYAGAAGIVLESTRGDKKQSITESLDRLRAGGSTNGGQGIVLAYQIARDHFIPGGTNRVILCSDGDFNVGVTGTNQLVEIAKENARSNIFLSVLGFGYDNHNDEMMERISNEGNGNYAFIDSKREAEKVFVEELGSTLVTVAKDVKIQIEFNPRKVSAYRLIGYENRMLAARDFADDSKDAGEIGAGHTVTALYELVPAMASQESTTESGELRYQTNKELTDRAETDEVLILKLRYKQPEGDTSVLMEVPVVDQAKRFVQTDRDFQLAAAVAGFGMLLRHSPHRGNLTLDEVVSIAEKAAQGDDFGYRTEFVELVKKARDLSQP